MCSIALKGLFKAPYQVGSIQQQFGGSSKDKDVISYGGGLLPFPVVGVDVSEHDEVASTPLESVTSAAGVLEPESSGSSFNLSPFS